MEQERKVFVTLNSFVLVPGLGSFVLVLGGAPSPCLTSLKKSPECLRKLH